MQRLLFVIAMLAAVGAVHSGEVLALQIDTAINNLDADDFDLRENATKQLIAADEAAVPALQNALKSTTEIDTRQRLRQILRQIEEGHPDRVLRLSLEAPQRPVLLINNRVKLDVTLVMQNTCKETVVICQPNAARPKGSSEPGYEVQFTNIEGKLLARDALIEPLDCAAITQESDYITLQPGQRVEIGKELPQCNAISAVSSALKPGKVLLRAQYTMKHAPDGAHFAWQTHSAYHLYKRAVACTVLSAPVEITLAEPPPLKQLVAMLASRQTAPYSIPEVIEALATLHPDKAADPLLAAARDKDASVRRAAIAALEFARQPRTIDALIDALADADMQVRANAILVLGRLTNRQSMDETWRYEFQLPPERSQQAISEWKNWWQQQRETFR